MPRMQMNNRIRRANRASTRATAGVLRAISGAAFGHSRSRRGSAIVLSVSALVLLSVLTLVYWGLGRSDAHTARTIRSAADVDTTVDHFAQYLSGVIGRDKTAWFVEPGMESGAPAVYREAWDFPWVDHNRQSVVKVANPRFFNQLRFDPAGTMPQSWDPLGSGPGTGLDILPFEGSDPWLSPHQPVFLGMTTALTGPDWKFGARDWWSISNFAPDGRFVNLFNLRNNFDSESGFTDSNQANAGSQTSTPRMMSDYLSLLRVNGSNLNASVTMYGGSNANPNTPADWTMRQQFAFRPTVDVVYPVDDPRHAFYQWADTDGDGFFDARWFELVDASVPNRLISLLPQDESMRWFFAARAVDLTGLVNVNTATDLRAGDISSPLEGDDEYRVGSTPADIDFLRILMMADSSVQSFIDPNDGGYRSLLQFDPNTTSAPIPANYFDYDMLTAANVAIESDAARDFYFQFKSMPPLGSVSPFPPLFASERNEQYLIEGAGVLPGQAYVDVRVAGLWETSSIPLFGMPSLLELLTYRGTNDDANTSPLERVLGGRSGFGNFSPLRDNRPLFLERLHAEQAIGNSGRAVDESMAWSAMDVRQLLTTISGAEPIRSSLLKYNATGSDPVRSFLEAVSQIGGVWNLSDTNPRSNFEGRFNANVALERASRTGIQADPRLLFQAYAEALLPHAGEPGMDPAWDNEQQDTLFYGHNPYRALLTAAHMTANAVDMYDDDLGNEPHAFTLLIDQSQRSQVTSRPLDFPFWQLASGRLDLGSEKLPINVPSNNAPQAINVFGVEAQPFLTEAAMFIIYTDAPISGGGDDDGGETDPVLLTVRMDDITIDGTIESVNSDFITQLLVFQVTNPFDEVVHLWSDTSKFYVEFADRYYPLGRVDRANLSLSGLTDPDITDVTLQPGDTKVFYASTFNLDDVDNFRLPDANSSRSIASWINRQLGTDAVHIGKVRNGASGIDLLDSFDAGDKNRVVVLWRVINDVANSDDDLMADRLRDPITNSSRATLDRRMEQDRTTTGSTGAPLDGVKIKGAGGLQEGDDNFNDPSNHNTGMSIALSGSIRRPRGSSIVEPSLGEFPAWCLESKYEGRVPGSLNTEDTIAGDPTDLEDTDFDRTSQTGFATAGEDTMDKMFTEHVGEDLFPALTEDPWWTSNRNIGTNIAGQAYSSIQAELHLDNNEFMGGTNTSEEGRALRVADMLLPLGVGPSHMPDEVSGAMTLGDDKWTTLVESMALALGYDTVSPSTPGRAMFADLHNMFDTGKLRLDTETQVLNPKNPYIPFIDVDMDGEWDQGEPTRGAGVPIAYNVLDVFTANDPRFGSMRRSRLGVINVNTAPLNVLRTVPMLSPPSTPIAGIPRWWWTGSTGEPTDASDVAASVFAYAHKATIPSISTRVNNVDFSNNGFFGFANTNARAVKNEFFGIRETPGFRSLGELMAVRGLDTDPPDQKLQDIDFMGDDGISIDMEGVKSIVFQNPSASAGQMIDDYDEKLAVMNSVVGTTSVRSDYFAVWFVVQGYQRDDVEGLRPANTNRSADPLTPTVTKRFVMVVDRTNVQRLGDKPRILMIQEVPM